jgi:hypothetical protein
VTYRISLITVTLIYLTAVTGLTLRDSYHPKILALGIQYALLLPVLLLSLLRPNRTGVCGINVGRRSAAGVILVYVVLVICLGRFWNGGISLTDESAYQFEARTFLSGRTVAEALPATSGDAARAARERFFEFFIIHGDRWFSQYSPGWPAVLALGIAVHAGWLVNPILGLLLLWLMYRIGSEIFDSQTSRLTLLLAVASPFFVAYTIGLLSHASCACAITGGVLCCLRASRAWRGEGSAGKGAQATALMALLIGAACLIRSVTGLACGAVLTAWLLWQVRGNRRAMAIAAALPGVAVLTAMGVVLLYNHACTGRYLLSLYGVFAQTVHNSLATVAPGSLVGNLLGRTRWSIETIELHSLPFVFLLAAAGLWNSRRSDEAWLLAGVFGALVAAHVPLTFTSGSVVGERYFYEAFPGVLILAARGCQSLVAYLRPSGAMLHTIAGLFLVIQAAHFVLFLGPMIATARMYREVAQFVQRKAPDGAVVFFEDEKEPDGAAVFKTTELFLGKHFNINQPDWRRAPAVYLTDPGPNRREAVAGVFGRPYWMVVTYDHEPRLVVQASRVPGSTWAEGHGDAVAF